MLQRCPELGWLIATVVGWWPGARGLERYEAFKAHLSEGSRVEETSKGASERKNLRRQGAPSNPIVV